MTIREAFFAAIARVNGAKRYMFLVYAMNLVLAVGLGSVIAGAIQSSVGASLAGENLRQGFDDLWYQSFASQATGLVATFNPGVVGIGSVLGSLDNFLQGKLFGSHAAIAMMGLLYLIVWTFASAGFIAVYAANDEETSFFKHAAHYFPRFAVLAILAGVLYYLIFHFVLQWLSAAVTAITRNSVDERVVFSYTVVKYVLVWGVVWLVNMVFDYGKILTVVRDHKNALSAPLRGLGFVFRHFGKTAGLYLALGVVWIVCMGIYGLIAPGAGQSSWITIIGAFVLGQIYLLSRIWTRCLFYGGQTALFASLPAQGE